MSSREILNAGTQRAPSSSSWTLFLHLYLSQTNFPLLYRARASLLRGEGAAICRSSGGGEARREAGGVSKAGFEVLFLVRHPA